LVPAERFHAQEQKALDDIANSREVTAQIQDIERSIANLVLAPDGSVMLYLLCQPVVIKGGSHVCVFDHPEEVAILIRAAGYRKTRAWIKILTSKASARQLESRARPATNGLKSLPPIQKEQSMTISSPIAQAINGALRPK